MRTRRTMENWADVGSGTGALDLIRVPWLSTYWASGPETRRRSVAELGEALGLGLALGVALGAALVVAVLALALAVHVDDPDRRAERAVAAVGLELLAPGGPAAVAIAAVPAPAAAAVAAATAASAAAAGAPAAAATAAPVVLAARVDDRLD